jgi:hypothetical protein
LAVKWCNDYNQDSVLIKAPDGTPQYYEKSGDVDDTMKFNGDVKINDMSQDYFTDFIKTLKMRDNSREHRFTFEGCYINPKPASLNERTVRDKRGEIIFDNTIKI